MSKIFELYGYRLDCWNEEATANREKAWCPFMDAECDGGGNRYLSALDISKNPKLGKYFPGKKIVQSGVCSLRLRDSEQPWIVCPRRLLSLKGQKSNYQTHVREQLVKYSNLEQGKLYRAWASAAARWAAGGWMAQACRPWPMGWMCTRKFWPTAARRRWRQRLPGGCGCWHCRNKSKQHRPRKRWKAKT